MKALDKRLEYKYLVPIYLIDSMRCKINPFVELDPHIEKSGDREYAVRSIYLDTNHYECYRTKIEGIKIRKKYRGHCYKTPTKNNIMFLEIKRKNNNNISKNRAPLFNSDLRSFFITKNFDKYILANSGNGKEMDNAKRFLYHYYKKGLHPAILIVYEREAYISKFDSNLRITFDKNLRSQLFPSFTGFCNENQLKFAVTKHFILEVKFNSRVPAWIKSIISGFNLQRRALSKYTICIDSHRQHKNTLMGLQYVNTSSDHLYHHITEHKNVQ